MSTGVLTSFSTNQASTINALTNAWKASPYSNNPNVLYQAIGVANGEANRSNSASGGVGYLPSDSNPDGPGKVSYGPFQYNSGGLGATLAKTYGLPNAGAATIDQQAEFTINTIGSGSNGGIGNWMSVKDSGGIANIQAAGQSTFNNAQTQGVIGATPASSPSTSSGVDSSQFDSNSGLSNGSDAFASPGSAGTSSSPGGSSVTSGNGQSVTDNTFGGTQSPTDLGGTASPVAGGATGVPGISSQGSGTFNDTTAAASAPSDAPPAVNTTQPTAASGSGATPSTAPQGSATDTTKSGTPETITNISNAGSVAANTVSKALGGATQGAAADTTAGISAGTGWLNSLFGEGTDLLARGGFILLGLFLLLGAFVFFYIDSKSSDQGVQVVPIPV